MHSASLIDRGAVEPIATRVVALAHWFIGGIVDGQHQERRQYRSGIRLLRCRSGVSGRSYRSSARCLRLRGRGSRALGLARCGIKQRLWFGEAEATLAAALVHHTHSIQSRYQPATRVEGWESVVMCAGRRGRASNNAIDQAFGSCDAGVASAAGATGAVPAA